MVVQLISEAVKPKGHQVGNFEKKVVQALIDLEQSTDLKPQLRELQVTGADKVSVGRLKAIIIWVPYPQLKAFQKIHARIVRELEKKFSGKTIVIIAKRTILPKPTKKSAGITTNSKQMRPKSRTLTAVHDAILEDLVYPAEIVGKRIQVRSDGSRLIRVHLDRSSQLSVAPKTCTIAQVYKKLTGKEVTFEFPEPLF